MLQCPTAIDLARFVEGNLALEQNQEIQGHIEHCKKCHQDIQEHSKNQALFLVLASVVNSNGTSEWPEALGQTDREFREQLSNRGYEVVDELQRGGQGVVYSAVQVSNERRVAVKRLKLQCLSHPEQIARFEREIEVATKLSHPNIVTMFDNGTIDGCPFLVMEFVNGLPLDRYVQQNYPCSKDGKVSYVTLRPLLNLFNKICAAVAYAHRLGVIHRDLKPTNIVMDHLGEPKILDFGLAKLIESPIHELTQTGQFLGTLAYASPEQVRYAVSPEIDTRTDVYSLGVILYELVTGTLPYSVDTDLSNAIRNIAENAPLRPRKINGDLDDDIETVILKALAKEPERRYQSVEQLGQDLELYLAGRPIEAKKDRNLYVLYKSVLRFKGYFVISVALLFAILAGLIGSVWFWNQAVEQRNLAKEAAVNESIAREQAEFQSYVANIVAAKGAILSNDVAAAKRRLNAAPMKYLGWEWRHFVSRTDQSRCVIEIHDLFVVDFERLTGTSNVASIAGDNTLKVWSIDDQVVLRERVFDQGLSQLDVSADGQFLAVIVAGNEIHVHDVDSLKPIKSTKIEGHVLQIEYVSQKTICFSQQESSGSRSMCLWNWVDDVLNDIELPFDEITDFSVNQDKTKIAVSGSDAGIFKLSQSEYESFGIQEATTQVKYIAAEQIALFNRSDEIIVVNAIDYGIDVRLEGHESLVNDVVLVGPHLLATASDDTSIRLWDAQTGGMQQLLRGHDQSVTKLERFGDETFISASNDGAFRIWDTNSIAQPQKWRGHDISVRDIEICSSTGVIASCAEDGRVILRDLATGKTLRVLNHHKPLFAISFSPDGQQLAVVGDEFFVRVWNLDDGTYEKLVGHTDRVHAVDHSPDGKLIVTGSRDKTVRVWDLESNKCVHVVDSHNECVHACEFHPGSQQFASRSHNDIRLWNVEPFQEIFQAEHRISPEDYSLSYDATGRFLAAGSSIAGFGRGYVNVFDLEALGESQSLEQHNSPINAMAFFPSSKRAVSASSESIKIWDLEHFVELANLDSLAGVPYCVAVSPDGHSVFAGFQNGQILVWGDGGNRIEERNHDSR